MHLLCLGKEQNLWEGNKQTIRSFSSSHRRDLFVGQNLISSLSLDLSNGHQIISSTTPRLHRLLLNLFLKTRNRPSSDVSFSHHVASRSSTLPPPLLLKISALSLGEMTRTYPSAIYLLSRSSQENFVFLDAPKLQDDSIFSLARVRPTSFATRPSTSLGSSPELLSPCLTK